MKHLIALALWVLVGIAPAAAQAPGAPLDAWQFRRMAAMTDLFEIQASQLALERTRNPAVLRFAERMIADHTTSSAGLRNFSDFGDVPRALDPRHAALLEELAGLEGRDFDRVYAGIQVTIHEEAVALYGAYARSGEWPELVGFARGALPGLQAHLDMAVRLNRGR